MSEVLMRVTAIDYDDDDELIVQLAGRDEDGNRRTPDVTDVVPYFYGPADEAEVVEDLDEVRDIQYGYSSAVKDTDLIRTDVQVPGNAGGGSSEKDVTEEFSETWESDIPFYRRVSIDYDLTGHIRIPDKPKFSIHEIETDVQVEGDDFIDPRVMIGDIEVIAKGDTSFEVMQEEYNSPISHFSLWDSKEDEYIVLHLDPDGEVDVGNVGAHLSDHIESEAADTLSEEQAKDIIIRSYQTEEDLAEGFLSVIESRRPDLISGWNWVDFDWDYILGRFEQLDVNEHRLSDHGWINGYKTERRVDCLPAFDMMDAYYDKMAMGEFRSKSLDYVTKQELGVGKLPNINVSQLFEDDKDRLLAYNIVDTMLCVALDRREGIHDFFYGLAELSQVQIYDTFSEMRLVDGYIMSQANDDEILPTMEEKDIPENAGGLVLFPSDGIKEWVGVHDLASLYPSSIITWNISPETINWYDDAEPEGDYVDIPWLPDADHAEGGEFDHDEIGFDTMWTDMEQEGIIPKYLRRLFPERQERKDKRDQYDPDDDLYHVWDRKQRGVKVIMNSFYGVSSNDYWRLGTHGLGDAITSAARYALWKGKQVAEDEGYEIYYGDTDSVMVSLAEPDEDKETALRRGHELEEAINSRMVECIDASGLEGEHPYIGDDLHGTARHALVYEFEKLYVRFLQVGSKKRYSGRIVWKEGKDIDGEIDTVGFESQRSDSPELTAKVQPEVINRILGGGEFDEVSEYVRDLIEKIEEREMDLYKVALPKSINQPLDEYGNTQTARAARYSNDNLDASWGEGDDPWLYFVSKTPPMTPGTDVIALDWDENLPEGFELDLNKVLDRAMKGPLSPILNEVGWRWAELKKGAKTESAADASWGGDYETESEDDDDWTVEEDEEEEEDEWGW
jgi:DNA polymerase elongation subunit (family B)